MSLWQARLNWRVAKSQAAITLPLLNIMAREGQIRHGSIAIVITWICPPHDDLDDGSWVVLWGTIMVGILVIGACSSKHCTAASHMDLFWSQLLWRVRVTTNLNWNKLMKIVQQNKIVEQWIVITYRQLGSRKAEYCSISLCSLTKEKKKKWWQVKLCTCKQIFFSI